MYVFHFSLSVSLLYHIIEIYEFHERKYTNDVIQFHSGLIPKTSRQYLNSYASYIYIAKHHSTNKLIYWININFLIGSSNVLTGQQPIGASKKAKFNQEAIDLHYKLGADLLKFIYGTDFKQFKFRFSGRICPMELDSVADVTDMFACLYKNNLIGIGDYAIVKEMVKDNNVPALKLIVDAENSIGDLNNHR